MHVMYCRVIIYETKNWRIFWMYGRIKLRKRTRMTNPQKTQLIIDN